MSVEQNKAIAHRIVEECPNKGDSGVVDELFAACLVSSSCAPGMAQFSHLYVFGTPTQLLLMKFEFGLLDIPTS